MNRVSVDVNGREVYIECEPRTNLADFLRDQLRLKGTHLGCEHGACGACTVLIDDAPARSCITLARSCQGSRVRTIEGLRDDEIVIALREAFRREHAVQCGYCTPGMLITARDIVQRVPIADIDTIRRELAGCICRCTGYRDIVRAIHSVVRQRAGAGLIDGLR
ncbi:MAG: (2Fe-2S)-binding protein [Hyphomicrobiaceae bacterium]